MNKYSQMVADYYAGKIALPKDFTRIYRTHKRKIRTMVDSPKPTAQMIYDRNWHYASRYGTVCAGFYGHSS